MSDPRPAILTRGLEKRFGDALALRGLDLTAAPGTILGVLGPNGAGKTTAVRILATLMRPDAGRAEIAGIDVLANPQAVRKKIGLAGQYASVDELLSGRENLYMVGRLFHRRRSEARQRADELLERFDLTEAASRPVKSYSGGMRRRLDLAASLVAEPPILFLDEPTTGLDPRSRLEIWKVVREQTEQGGTVLLTTQYLDEADQLADTISVIDHGRVIAQGTADELKSQVGGDRLDVTTEQADDLSAIARVLEGHATGPTKIDHGQRLVSAPVTNAPGLLSRIMRDLDTTGAHIVDFNLRRPALDDVFLTLTGSATTTTEPEKQEAR